MKTQGKVWIIYDGETKTQTKPMSVVQAQVTLLSFSPQKTSQFFIWTPGWDEWICVKDFLSSDQKYFAISQPPRPPGEAPQRHKAVDDDLTLTQNAPATNGSDSIYTQVVVGEAPLKPQEIGGYHIQDFHGNELDLQKIQKIKPAEGSKKKILDPVVKDAPKKESDRRKDTRHNFKIEVVLVSKIRSFRTYSQNISLSGTMLEDEIPKDFLNKPFDLIIVNPFESDPAKARLLFRAKIVGDLTDPRRLMFIEQDVAMTLRLDALLKAYVAYQDQLRRGS